MVCVMKETKVIMFMWLNGSGPLRVAKLELFLLEDIAIKLYEFLLWWPLWVCKKPEPTFRERELPSSAETLKRWKPFVLTGCV